MTLDMHNMTGRIKRFVFLSAAFLFVAAFDIRLHIKHYEITTDQTAETLRIALLTDLHSCKYGKDGETLIRAIDSQQPDLILLGGDICDYVTGNHEYWSGRIDDILELFRSYHVTVLNGSSDTIKIGAQPVTVCGVTDPDAVTYAGAADIRSQLEDLSDTRPPECYTLLLAHRPELIGLYLQYDYDLVLSGHAHGGQWRLPGIINGLYAPDQGWFPRYAGGMYVKNDQVMIVSRGLARESTKVPRIFNRPELVIVTVKP